MIWTFLYVLGGSILAVFVLLNAYSFYKEFEAIKKYPMSFKDIKNLLTEGNFTKFENGNAIFGDNNIGLFIVVKKSHTYNYDNTSTAIIYTDNVPHYFYMTEKHRKKLLSIAYKSSSNKLKEKIQLSSLNKAIVESNIAAKILESNSGNAVVKMNMEKS